MPSKYKDDEMKKILVWICLTFFFYTSESLSAELLNFKEGSVTRFLVGKKEDFESTFSDEEHYFSRNISGQLDQFLVVDVKLVALNSETLSYPFEVEVIVRKIFLDVQQIGFEIKYDSNKCKNLDDRHAWNKLIDLPCHFKIDSAEHIEVMTDELNEIASEEAEERNFQMEHFPTTVSDLKFFLRQLFCLAGKELNRGESHSAPGVSEVFQGGDIDDEEMITTESSSFTVVDCESEKIQVLWQADADFAAHEENFLEGKGALRGKILWSVQDAMVQEGGLSGACQIDFCTRGMAKGCYERQLWIEWSPMTITSIDELVIPE